MSLLRDFSSNQAKEIARIVFDEHFKYDKQLKKEMDERRQIAMYQDILYNLSYLEIAISFDDDIIFQDYAVWIYELLCHLMPDLTRQRIAQQMIDHYRILSDVVQQHVEPHKAKHMMRLLELASLVTKEAIDTLATQSYINQGDFKDIQQLYLDKLLNNDTRGAIKVILEAVQSGTSIQDIYLNVFKDVMYEVGHLWHHNIITVDKEHYCTSVTQMAIAQFYDEIFSKPRIERKVLTASVGSELHEMGIRMISDLFEYHGWDSVYLGASIPSVGMLNAIKEHNPELVCLSVTMPHHLNECHQLVNRIKADFPTIKIAVGGQAFTRTSKIWKQWNIDFFSDDVSSLISWAQSSSKRIS